ncbi:MAG: type II secretion system protein GspC [Myxococcota bacterium]
MGGLGQLGIRLANIGLFVACAYVTSGIVNEVGGEWLAPPVAAAAAPPPAARSSRAQWQDRQPILDRNLFGAQLAGEDLPEPEPDEDLQETRLPLRLLGTAAADDPALSTAAIEDKGSQEHQVVRVGDRLEKHPRVEIASIERKRVVLLNGAKREELVLDEDAPPSRPTRRTARRATSRRERPKTRISDRLQQLRERAERAAESPRSAATLFSDARILPKYESGEMVGIQLSAIKSGSMYEKFGFKDGDVITELNGIEINNPASSAKLLSELTQAEEFEFTVNGQKKTIPADQVADILDQL